ncbi:MAG: hypothetical protein LBN95_04295 [Prevotellaceae bacterium]|jgi:hypothetical protein|nr:hypothetical protein [Prevotellaceae bacterium]
MRIKSQKYNQRKIKVISLIFCVLYFAGGIALPAFHSHFHKHEVTKIACECAENTPTHFHQISFDYNFHAKCPICQQGNVFALINSISDYYLFVFAEKTQKQICASKKYSADFSISAPRAPPIF